jgi:CHAT domain-containing protein
MAGARTVVASTWAAEDNATAELMRNFYQHLKNGADKAEALTLAKRDLLAKYGSNARPFLWAGFRLVGDPHGTIEGD